MPSLNEIRARLRAAHLLVRTAEEWDSLSTELLRAYDSKNDELIQKSQETYLAAWKSVARNILTDTFEPFGIAVGAATHPWGIATLEAAGRSCQPLLATVDARAAGTAASGRAYLRSFDEVMANYDACLTFLSGPAASHRRDSGGNFSDRTG